MTVHSLDEDAPAPVTDRRPSTGTMVQPCGRPPRGVAGAILFLGDLMVLVAAVLLAVVLRMQLRWLLPIEISPDSFVGVAVSAAFLPLVFAAAGLYPGYGQGTVERLRKRVIVTALWFGMMILFDRLAQDGQWSRGILLAAAVVSLAALPLWDAAARSVLIRRGWWGEPVVVLGSAKRRATLVRALTDLPDLGWVPVAEGEIPGQGGPEHGEPPVAGVAVAVVVPDGGLGVSSLADHLPYRRVVLVPEVDALQSLWVTVRDLGSHIGLEMQRNLLIPTNQTIKRALDIVLATLALTCSIPIILLFGGLVAAVSPGPIFYRQTRIGLDGHLFSLWKLRTMVPDADKMLSQVIQSSAAAQSDWHQSMKIKRDPRIIPVLGHLMRRFSIDELPQFWNVLRGDMSLVGPRPLPSYHVERLDPAADRIRRRVRPGVTGLWQVSGRSATSIDDQERLDTYYVRNWSLWLDIYILARTVLVVLTGRGAW